MAEGYRGQRQTTRTKFMAEKPIPLEVGIRMRAVFRKLGISIDEAAAELEETRQNLSNVLNGYQLPRPGVAYQLEKMLPGVSIQWILFGDEGMVPAKLARELRIFVALIKEKTSAQEPAASKESARAFSTSPHPSKKLARAGG